ncbi:MAG: nitrilase [Deltaproteobacteria bacterium]|nr:nitrilase [Deltaproteobacteria bacterium]
MKRDIRIALICCRSLLGCLDENIDVMEKWTSRAAGAGVEIICFPELNITGYPSAKINDIPAESIPGKSTGQILKLAAKHQVTILAGIAQSRGNETLATHIVITPHGIDGVYQKIHLGPSEKERFIAGDKICVFEIQGFKFGIQLCYDSHFPELSTAMAEMGVDAIFIPHASPNASSPNISSENTSPKDDPDTKFKSWSRHLTARAYDNSIFIAAVNQVGDNGHGLTFPGVATVIDPSGNIYEKYTGYNETMLVADLKKSAMDHVRGHRMRYFLPNRRPEIYGRRN